MQEEAVKSFDLDRVRERLAAVRAAETHRQQREGGSGFNLNRTRERLAAVRAAEGQKKQREAQREHRSGGIDLPRRSPPPPRATERPRRAYARASRPRRHGHAPVARSGRRARFA